jgi:hypothetical protein
MTTRKHYPGPHRVDVILNGRSQLLGSFDLSAGSKSLSNLFGPEA